MSDEQPYEMPAWELAHKAAEAQQQRDAVQYTLAHLERVEGRIEVANPDEAIAHRRYRLPEQSLSG